MSLVITNISKAFNNNIVLRDINFKLEHGELITINGANGTGKTTLCNLVANIITPDSGSIAIAKQRNYLMKMGYSSSNERSFFYKLNAYQNLEFFLTMRGIKKENCANIIKKYFDMFQLKKNILEIPYAHLSSGVKKKISLIRCMAHDPYLLIFDEPTEYLDAYSSEIFIKHIHRILKDRNTPRICMIATHNNEIFSEFISKSLLLEDDLSNSIKDY